MKKTNNKLIKLTINNQHFYFTSTPKISRKTGRSETIIRYNLQFNRKFKDIYGNDCEICYIDGSEIMYKDIDNEL